MRSYPWGVNRGMLSRERMLFISALFFLVGFPCGTLKKWTKRQIAGTVRFRGAVFTRVKEVFLK